MMKNKAQTKQGVQPKLRFPEFRDAANWDVKPLNKICDVNPSNTELPESFVYIDLESVSGGKLSAKKRIHKDAAPSRAQRLLKNEDVIFQIVRPYQRNNLFCNFEDCDHYVASTGYAQLRAFDSSSFLYQAIHTDGFVDSVIAKCTGSSYPAINSSDLAKIAIAIPDGDEQQKIADCLSSLDELIEAEDQKLDALQQHKKGLMQELFPAEGETLPTRRFPEFKNAPEWEEKPLEKIFSFKQGYQVPVEMQFLESKQDRERFIRIIDITQKNEPPRYIDTPERASILSENDLFMVRYGTPGLISMGYNGIIANNLFQLIFIFPSNHSPRFWYYNLKGKEDLIATLSGSSSMPAISFKTLEGLRVKFPKKMEEQERIADCLSSIDYLITDQSQKLDALRNHKKGLMQQLFPTFSDKSEG